MLRFFQTCKIKASHLTRLRSHSDKILQQIQLGLFQACTAPPYQIITQKITIRKGFAKGYRPFNETQYYVLPPPTFSTMKNDLKKIRTIKEKKKNSWLVISHCFMIRSDRERTTLSLPRPQATATSPLAPYELSSLYIY